MADDTITELVGQLATAPWTGPIGEKYAGVVCGLANDTVIEAASKALQSSFLYPILVEPEDYEQPAEAIDLLGRDALLLHYPGEDIYTGLRERVRNKWSFWQSGIKPALLAELTAAGFSGVQIKVPNDYAPRPAPSSEWSRFWVFMPQGTHPVSSGLGFIMANGAAGVVGVNRLGPAGINSAAGEAYLNRMKDVLRRMKPAQWVVWDIIFEIVAGVSYVHLQYKPRFSDPHYAYTSAGAALPLGV